MDNANKPPQLAAAAMRTFHPDITRGIDRPRNGPRPIPRADPGLCFNGAGLARSAPDGGEAEAEPGAGGAAGDSRGPLEPRAVGVFEPRCNPGACPVGVADDSRPISDSGTTSPRWYTYFTRFLFTDGVSPEPRSGASLPSAGGSVN